MFHLNPSKRAVNKNTEQSSVFLFIRAKRDRKRTVGSELSRRSADRGVASVGESELAQDSTPTLGNERASDGERLRRNDCRPCHRGETSCKELVPLLFTGILIGSKVEF